MSAAPQSWISKGKSSAQVLLGLVQRPCCVRKASAVRKNDVDSAESVEKLPVDTVVAVPDDKNSAESVEKLPVDTVVAVPGDKNSAESVEKLPMDTVVAAPDDKNGFYINIELTKESKKKILLKTMEEGTGGYLPSFMAGAAANLAGVVVSTKTIINEVAGELVSAMPAEMGSAGIDLDLKKRFVDGNLAILHARVKNINLDKGVKEEYGEAGCQHFDKMMAALDFFDAQEEKKELLDELALEIVGEMRKEMQTSLPKEFAKEGLECVVEVVGEAEEAEYMLSQLERQQKEV